MPLEVRVYATHFISILSCRKKKNPIQPYVSWLNAAYEAFRQPSCKAMCPSVMKN